METNKNYETKHNGKFIDRMKRGLELTVADTLDLCADDISSLSGEYLANGDGRLMAKYRGWRKDARDIRGKY